jgi:hypothetical protein
MIISLRKHRSLAIFFTALIAMEIFYFSSIKGTEAVDAGVTFNLSIIYHLLAFFLLNFFLMYSLKQRNMKIKSVFFSAAIALLYAISDEIHQMFVPFRSAGIFDVLIDSIGVLFASLLFIITENSGK